MSNLTIARRYAQALLEGAAAAGSKDAVDQDIASIRDALDNSPELVRFFGSPVISRDKKKAVVDSLFSDRLDAITVRMLHLLVDKQREGEVMEMAAAYQDLRDEQEGIVQVAVRSARELSKDDLTAISTVLEKRLAKRVRLDVSVDASLIGGIVIQVGDTVYDGSVSNKLASLRERMLDPAMMN
ncbi:MAG: F-type H+-transporting ATPase subunit delta [Rhodothermales bacterium]|jgi:F-type H+-transporting ATPase subunit delta